MSDSLFSQSWYRVEKLKPQLRSHTKIHRQKYRGETWFVLQDDIGGKFSRFSKEAKLIIELMDGRYTMQQIWERACEQLGDDMPTQDELIYLLGQLYKFNVLRSDTLPDIADLNRRFQVERKNKLVQYVKSPLSLKIPLIDPEVYLKRTAWVGRWLFNRVTALIWLTVVITALIQLGIHWKALTENFTDQAFSTGNFIALALVYPVIKLIHELGHAYAIKRWQGEVHELGLMFLVFIPVPYVDASSSVGFRSKYQRMLVAGSGILVEAFLAAVAVLLWVSVEPGLFRAFLFNVMLIGGISTVLFNGNPLLRFDAYYVLSDWLEIPNLATRSNGYVGYWCRRYLLRIEELSPSHSKRESCWLFFYSILAFCYRMFVMVTIALFVAANFFIIGVLLACWSIYNGVLAPLNKVVKYLWQDAVMKRFRTRVGVAVSSFLALLALLLFVPLPSFTVVPGVFWAPEKAQVHAGADCFVQAVLVAPGQSVTVDQALIQCASPEIQANVAIAQARLAELQAKHRATIGVDQTEANILKDEMQRTEAELSLAEEQLAAMVVRAPVTGITQIKTLNDLVGRFLPRGSYLGYIQQQEQARVRVSVSQDDIHKVRYDLKGITARRADHIDQEVVAEMIREVPAGSRAIPDPALTLEGGGDIVVDPAVQSDQPQALENWFQFDLRIPNDTQPRVGEKVYVRFEHSPTAIAERAYLLVRRLFLKEFAV